MRSSVVLNTARLAMNSAGRGGSANLQSQSQQVYRGFFNIPRTFFSKGVVPSTATIAVRAFRTFNTQPVRKMIESAATRQLQRQGGRRTKATVSAEAGSSSGAAAAAAVASEAALVLHSSNRLLGGWMFGVSAAVFGMVAVGGYTRLTRSGLSMTDWRPQGRKLPSTDEEWDVEFDKYKATPEFMKLNMHMDREEFKSIYFWEWFHRMWGRSLGVVFAAPLAVFLARKDTRNAIVKGGFVPRLALLFTLGGMQGLVGWWMVKSGLEHTHVFGFDRPETDMPRVSPYRLATHLSVAFVTYGLLCWTSMDFFASKVKTAELAEKMSQSASAVIKKVVRIRQFAIGACTLVGITVFSGAFVAGNLAGLAYNDWPWMAGKFVPLGIAEQWNDFTPRVRNVFENIAMVQFDHRMLAYTTLGVVTAMWATARGARGQLPAATMFRMNCLLAAVWGQASLGVATIMMNVPVELGVMHQAGALTSWTLSIWLLHSLRFVRLIR